jgi:hypothetical protein
MANKRLRVKNAYSEYVKRCKDAGTKPLSMEDWGEDMFGRKYTPAEAAKRALGLHKETRTTKRALKTSTTGVYLKQVRARLAKAMAATGVAVRAKLPWETEKDKREYRELLAHIQAGRPVVIGEDNRVRAVSEEEFRAIRVRNVVVDMILDKQYAHDVAVQNWLEHDKF